MKLKLLSAFFLFCFINVVSQTDGWHLYTKPSKINKILPDDSDPDALHIATDMGYIKKSLATNVVVGINLTSQNPAIGEIHDMALDPTSGDIAWTLDDAIAIYNGTSIDIYSYDDSGLTIGETTSAFIDLEVSYAQDGSLYVFKPDAFGYQKFNNGVFDTEVTTSFQPQDIIENTAGTKAYFAGANNGLWELEKATTTWTNYTMANSNLTSNFLTSFAVDASDNVLIGHYQGLNRLEPDGTLTSCSATVPIAVFEISLSPTSNDILVRCSEPNLSYNGLSVVDYDLCTWNNYKEDGTNCLDENVYSACTYGGNGLAYVAPQVFSPIEEIGNVYEFTVPTESCANFDINYLNAPVAVNSAVVTDFAIREKTNGNLELGFTRTNDLHIVEIDPTTFNGSFPTPTTVTPSPGNNLFSLITNLTFFIVETNAGWAFVDENYAITTFDHNIPDYLAIVTKKTTKYDAQTGIINIIHKGFDASFNYRVYKTQCNAITGICAPSEEIFTNDRDLTQNILFGVEENQFTGEVVAVAVKTNSAGNVKRIQDRWSSSLNDTPLTIWDEDHPLYPIFDPNVTALLLTAFIPNETTIQIRTEDGTTGMPTLTDSTIDNNNDGTPDTIVDVGSSVISDGLSNKLIANLVAKYWDPISASFYLILDMITAGNNGSTRAFENGAIPDTLISNGLPDDIQVRKVELRQYSLTKAFVVYFTNYGLLVKTGVDISSLTLSNDEISTSDTALLIHPNPAKNSFSIASDLALDKLEIINVEGRLIKSFNTKQENYNIEDLPMGMYFVKMSLNGNRTTKKLIKQ